MNSRQLARFPFLQLIGAQPPSALRSLIDRAKAGHWVVVFAEGEIRPQGAVEQVHGGASWLSKQADVPLVPVALRVVMRGYRKPEAFLRFGRPVHGSDLLESLNTLPRLGLRQIVGNDG